MSTDIIYSNSDGSITATALVETAGEWMNGIRTANEVTFQIARPGPVTVRLLIDSDIKPKNFLMIDCTCVLIIHTIYLILV